MLKKNDFVVFKNPMPDEIWKGEPLRFMILEVNGDRALIEAVTPSLHIRPTQTALIVDLVKVEDDKTNS